MKLAICDDEKRIRDIIAESVKEVSEKIEIELYADAKGILSASLIPIFCFWIYRCRG